MDKPTRRALLRALAGGALSTAGTIVIARSALADVPGTAAQVGPAHIDVRARAAALEHEFLPPEDAYAQFGNFGGPFRNGMPRPFRNVGGPPPRVGEFSFRNRNFRNGGPFRNGGFPNVWRNSSFRNGGWRNGPSGFRNGPFRNGFRNRP
jgi:hypothetical protein